MWAEKENIVTAIHNYSTQSLFSREPVLALAVMSAVSCAWDRPSRASDRHLGLLCAMQCCV